MYDCGPCPPPPCRADRPVRSPRPGSPGQGTHSARPAAVRIARNLDVLAGGVRLSLELLPVADYAERVPSSAGRKASAEALGTVPASQDRECAGGQRSTVPVLENTRPSAACR